MKAYEIHKVDGVNQLKFVDRIEPTPGAGQVLVKVRATSINDRDRTICKGTYPFALNLPLVPLSDGVGEVVALGEGVTRVKIGDRVCGHFVQKWIAGELTEWMTQFTLGSILLGMLAEYVVLDETGVVPIPEHLTDEEAATLPSAALTAWHCLMTERGILTPGHRESFEAMNRAIAISQLHPVIDRVFDFEQAQAAFDYMDSGKYFGKVVIGSPKIG